MACRNCKSIEEVQVILEKYNENDWLNYDQVMEICSDCAENMVKHNITRIKKSALKLGNVKMKLYEVIYKGDKGSKYCFFGHTLEPYTPIYLESLPATEKIIKKLKDIVLNIVEVDAAPTPIEAKIRGAKESGSRIIGWFGASPTRMNDYGKFIRGEVYFESDLGTENFNKLLTTHGFREVK